ncbi:MAG: SRPBCC family protein [Bacteroidota bacterium]
MKGTLIQAKVLIRATPEKVWAVLRQPANIAAFHPLIKSAKMLEPDQRQCDLLPMGQMVEQISDWQEGASYVTEVIGGKMLPPYEFMKGKIKLKEQGINTLVQFSFHYKLKFGIFGKLLNMLLVKPQFKGAPNKYVNGLKAYVELL